MFLICRNHTYFVGAASCTSLRRILHGCSSGQCAWPVPRWFRGPVEGFAMSNLISPCHEFTYKFCFSRPRKPPPPDTTRPNHPDSCSLRGPVAFWMRGSDGRRNIRGELNIFRDAGGKRHDPGFWKCRYRSHQSKNSYAEQYRYGHDHDFTGDRHGRRLHHGGLDGWRFDRRRTVSRFPD